MDSTGRRHCLILLKNLRSGDARGERRAEANKVFSIPLWWDIGPRIAPGETLNGESAFPRLPPTRTSCGHAKIDANEADRILTPLSAKMPRLDYADARAVEVASLRVGSNRLDVFTPTEMFGFLPSIRYAQSSSRSRLIAFLSGALERRAPVI
jgi:hypothetical protein